MRQGWVEGSVRHEQAKGVLVAALEMLAARCDYALAG